jgi:hypothetical protein
VLIDDMTNSLCNEWKIETRLRETPGGADGVQSARRGLHDADGGPISHFLPSSPPIKLVKAEGRGRRPACSHAADRISRLSRL